MFSFRNSIGKNFLIDGLSEPVIKHLLDDLRGENVVNSGESEEIVQKTKTRTDQARDLIDCVKRKGRKASEILLKCLEKRDECVYKNLNMDGHSKIPETAVTSSHIPITSGSTTGSFMNYSIFSLDLNSFYHVSFYHLFMCLFVQ